MPADHPVHALLAEQGIEGDPGEPLILRRSLKADGGSRAFVGAATVPAGLLREIGALAVEIHGQHDERGLLNPRGHRALLDAFGGLDVAPVATAWAEVTRDRSELAAGARASLRRPSATATIWPIRSPRSTLWRRKPGEETRLAEERAAMQAGLKAGESLTGLDELLGGSDGALAQLRLAARRIERGAAEHPLLGEALAALDRAVIEASEAEDKIARAADALDVRPGAAGGGRGAAVRNSRARPQAPRRAGRAGRACATRCATQLSEIEAGGERIAELDRELEQARLRYSDLAADAEPGSGMRRRRSWTKRLRVSFTR